MTYPNKYAFIRDDLSMYERIDPDEFPSYDHVDSEEINSARGYDGRPDAD